MEILPTFIEENLSEEEMIEIFGMLPIELSDAPETHGVEEAI